MKSARRNASHVSIFYNYFLKGKNNRDWQANFDWLIKDSNMAKTLDGNYDNKSALKQQVVEDDDNKEFLDFIKSIS